MFLFKPFKLFNESIYMLSRHHLFSKAWTARGLIYSAKWRIFNNVIYEHVRYMHLTKTEHIHKIQIILSSERMLHKDYDCKGSVEQNLWPWA
jgi:hypothetical protein